MRARRVFQFQNCIFLTLTLLHFIKGESDFCAEPSGDGGFLPIVPGSKYLTNGKCGGQDVCAKSGLEMPIISSILDQISITSWAEGVGKDTIMLGLIESPNKVLGSLVSKNGMMDNEFTYFDASLGNSGNGTKTNAEDPHDGCIAVKKKKDGSGSGSGSSWTWRRSLCNNCAVACMFPYKSDCWAASIEEQKTDMMYGLNREPVLLKEIEGSWIIVYRLIQAGYQEAFKICDDLGLSLPDALNLKLVREQRISEAWDAIAKKATGMSNPPLMWTKDSFNESQALCVPYYFSGTGGASPIDAYKRNSKIGISCEMPTFFFCVGSNTCEKRRPKLLSTDEYL